MANNFDQGVPFLVRNSIEAVMIPPLIALVAIIVTYQRGVRQLSRGRYRHRRHRRHAVRH